MPSLACPWCPCRTGNNVVPSVCFVSEGTAMCFPKIHARPLEGIRILHSRNFNTPAMSHAVVKCKLNHKELCELLQVSFIFAFFFFLPSPSKQRSSFSAAKDNHPSPWSAEIPKSRNASLGRLFTALQSSGL